MSYIPARAMHRAAPAAAKAVPVEPPQAAPAGLFRRLSGLVSPRSWTAVAIVAGAIATGVTAAAVADAVVAD